ncbi:hypothetical protein EZ449_06200 [Pedobacter frigidisoli]|uniref:TANFOR domain-containing protein n=1 Tax=Pedobacter frigidisoli TaxID=2530455 RepID=A0A4R0P2P7_9SPHI|nr:hypothetical protein [Pedobacter frigidisoli]TCD11083.1 hypothetical protein EZ449_06200 [Pedobacter frigidisoli]
MKNFSSFKWITIICLILLQIKAIAQVNVSIQILPPYPTKFTDYASKPHLMVISITNNSSTNQKIQLRGTVTGDNGIVIRVKPGYRSSSPIELGPGEARMLNGNDISYFFNYNQLEYSGITQNEFINKGGLPEGRYQLCIRAYNYDDNNIPLSADEPAGCSNSFSVSSLEPPIILSPRDEEVVSSDAGQIIPLRWNTPVGTPPGIQYRIRMVEVLGNKNPNDAMMTARQPYFFDKEVMTNMEIFNPASPQLTPGRKYAMMVQAFDPSNNAVFRNQGRSEVISFTYGKEKTQEIIANVVAPTAQTRVIDCNCKTSIASQTAMDVSNKTLQEIGTIKIGEFDLVVKNLISANADGLTGSGTIKLPSFLSGMPILVTFKDVKINSTKQVISGQAIAVLSEGAASLIPTYDPNKPNSTLNTASLGDFSNQMADPQKLFSNLNPSDQIGYKLPLGIDNTIGNKKMVLAITQMVFDARQAVFDAGFVLNMPDAMPNVAALGASNICFNPSGLCGQGRLYLSEDLSINVSGSEISLKARKNGALPTDSGTYVVFDKQGFSRLRIQGEYSFPQNLIKAKAGGAAKATIIADAVSWNDWIASVTLPAFQMANNTDFVFNPTTLFYDHSDARNPSNMPQNYQESNVAQWRGFFAPKLAVELPPVLTQENASTLSIQSQNLIIDNRGVTGNLEAVGVFLMGGGSLSTWSCSLDTVKVNFKYNSFVNGRIAGKVMLPFTNQSKASSQLRYSSTISSDASGLKYNFTIAQTNELEVPMWFARFKLDNSKIEVNAGTGITTSAMLTMNGALSIVTKIPIVGKVDFDLVSFQNLKFGTKDPYFEQGTVTFGQSSPPKFVGGFPITLSKAPSLATGEAGEIGLSFPISINLADMASLPKAEVAFSVFGKFTLNKGKVSFGFSRVRADSITVEGKIASFDVKGKLGFFENDQKWGDGVDGFLKVGFLKGFEITARGLFGKREFNYFFLDARLNLPTPGIVVGPGISIFGFGGGAYYNLIPTTDPKRSVSYTYTTDPVRSLYNPSKGSLGFKAGVNLGTSDGTMLLMMGDLEATFNYENFAMQVLKINATGALFAPPPGFSNLQNAMVKAGADILYDFQHSVFSAKAIVDMNYLEIIKAHSELSILSAPDGYHFKIGDAGTESTWTSIEMMKIFKGSFYMNVGNKDMSYSPRMGKLMSQIFPGGNMENPSGFFFGAKQDLINIDLRFLIFYLKLNAGFNFDVALINTRNKKIECDGETKIGLDGYYATGRAEAYVYGEFGLYIDAWFFEGKVSAGSLGVTAGVNVGLPNPTWLEGWVNARYSVLNNLVSGNMRFKASVGKKCTIEVNPFAGLPIISELKPSNDEKKVSILSDMSAALNYYVNREFEVASIDDDGNEKNLKFKAVIRSITLNGAGFSANYTNDVNDNNGGNAKLSLKRDKEAVFFGWQEALPGNTKMDLIVNAEGYKWENNRWVLIAGSGQEEKVTFTTGDCPKNLQGAADGVQIVVGSYPFKGQQFFTPKHESRGYIWLKLALPCLAANNQSGSASSKTLAIFRSLTDTIEVPVSMEGNKITYAIPTNLKPSTMYRMQIVHRITPMVMTMVMGNLNTNLGGQNAAPLFIGNTNFNISSNSNPNPPSNNAFNNAALGVTVNQNLQQSANATTLQLGDGNTIENAVSKASASMRTKEEVMYTLYFKTSKYQTLEEKVNAFNVNKKLNAEQWNLSNFSINSSEEFDEYELQGWNYPGAAVNYIIPPLLEFREQLQTNTWINKHVREVSRNFYMLNLYAEFPVGVNFEYDILPKVKEARFWDPAHYAGAQTRIKQRNVTSPIATKKALTQGETKDFEAKLNPFKRFIDNNAGFMITTGNFQPTLINPK